MFRLYKDTVIYVFCPAKTITGGPEALHQLCDAINLQGGKAKMVYVNYSTEKIIKSSKPLQYWMYCSSSSVAIEDDEKNIAVVPEIWPHLLSGYTKIQKAVWWLSVNYLRDESILKNRNFHHLYQSVYAREFLLAKGVIAPLALYDYINVPSKKKLIKKKQVCYNPKKGFEITKQIIARLNGSGILFIPLEGLSRKEMAAVLAESVVYIDFGEHPGKDRIPREAALAGNIVISSINGSASFYEDLSFPDKYKFRTDQLDEAALAIKDGITNYDVLISDFNGYIDLIRNEKKQFFGQAATLFVGENFSWIAKLGRARYKLFPLQHFIFGAELLINSLTGNLSSSAKKNIRKLPFFNK
jgi:hypothetical protein